MKRKGFIYENLINKDRIKEAFYDVSKGRTKRLTVKKFEKDLDNKIMKCLSCHIDYIEV